MPFLIALLAFGILALCAALAWFLFATGGSMGFKILASASVMAGIPALQRLITTAGYDWRYLGWAFAASVSAAVWFAAWEVSKHPPQIRTETEKQET